MAEKKIRLTMRQSGQRGLVILQSVQQQRIVENKSLRQKPKDKKQNKAKTLSNDHKNYKNGENVSDKSDNTTTNVQNNATSKIKCESVLNEKQHMRKKKKRKESQKLE